MVGGGKDAFIGAIHRHAAFMDGLIELSCGALSINPEIARDSGKHLFLPEDRTYLTFDEMLEKESKLPADKRIDFVTIVTPNRSHFAVAKLFPTDNICAVIGGLTLFELSVGMILFTVLMSVDIFIFGQHMRTTVSEEAIGPDGDTLPMFGTVGKAVLVLIGLLICSGWFLVGIRTCR